MATGLSPAGVPARGVSGRLALSVLVVGLAAIVGVALFGKADGPPEPRSADVTPGPQATPLAYIPPAAWAADPTPSPTELCVTPSIGPLADPITRHPRDLVRTGIETVGAISGGIDALVADRDGGIWGTGAGRLLRFDAHGRLTGTWTFEDDPSLVASGLVASGEGGVWLLSGRSVRWFDGVRFRDVVSTPGDVNGLAEGPDGSLWATISGRGLFHWDGRLWMRVCGSPADADVIQPVVAPDGGIWVSFSGPSGSPSANPAHYDGHAWVTYPGEIHPSDAGLVALADGTVWCAGQDHLARFDGVSWTGIEHQSIDLAGLSSLVPASDGSVWGILGSYSSSADGTHRLTDTDPSVLRYDGARWRVFGHADGLPASNAERRAVSAVAIAGTVVFAGSMDGLYRLDGNRWSATWKPTAASPGPAWISSTLAVSHDEAWVVGGSASGTALWHLEGRRWTPVPIADWPAPASSYGLLAAEYRAGVLAVAGDPGLAVFADGRWVTLAKGAFQAADVADDGRTVYAIGPPDGGGLPVAATFRYSGARWDRTDVRIGSAGGQVLAVDRSGSWWYEGACGASCPLEAMTGGRITEVKPTGEGITAGVTAVETAANGDVWALLETPSADDGRPGTLLAARYRDGAWRMFGPADGFISAWASRLVVAPDGGIWIAGDALWRYDGASWTVVRPGWFWDVAFAPDGTAWATEPTGIARLPADVVHPAALSDAAVTWCAGFANWSAVHEAALSLGIDEAGIDARTSAIVAARSRQGDPAAFTATKRLDGEYVRACGAAFASAR